MNVKKHVLNERLRLVKWFKGRARKDFESDVPMDALQAKDLRDAVEIYEASKSVGDE